MSFLDPGPLSFKMLSSASSSSSGVKVQSGSCLYSHCHPQVILCLSTFLHPTEGLLYLHLYMYVADFHYLHKIEHMNNFHCHVE